jgi:hypothetical protein
MGVYKTEKERITLSIKQGEIFAFLLKNTFSLKTELVRFT